MESFEKGKEISFSRSFEDTNKIAFKGEKEISFFSVKCFENEKEISSPLKDVEEIIVVLFDLRLDVLGDSLRVVQVVHERLLVPPPVGSSWIVSKPLTRSWYS